MCKYCIRIWGVTENQPVFLDDLLTLAVESYQMTIYKSDLLAENDTHAQCMYVW